MTPPDLLRAVTEAEIGREIVRLVPHWYEAECGPEKYSVPIREHAASFCNHCKLTPNLSAFLARISARTRELPLEHFISLPSLIDVLLESFAIDWLRMHAPSVDWPRLIKYLETVARRTYENRPVALNLIVRPGQGVGDITRPTLQKFFDQLASSAFSYLAVDGDLRLMHYGEVEWNQIARMSSYKLHPEFLHPVFSIMEDGDLSAHLTAQGDLIIMSKAGLLATRRKRKWKIYDVRTFKNSLSYCLGSTYVGANLFEVVFDLSFRRQGALMVYDPEHRLQDHLLNTESMIRSDWRTNGDALGERASGQALVGRSIEDIAVGKKAGGLKRKRRLVEMACVDGATIFDDDHLLAVGALIRSHPAVGNQLGARTTAARSAYLWGGHPIKVSSDGDVTIYFRSSSDQQQCDAVMNFL
ncbi:MAG: hypothetical protein ABSG68_13815 [Thermoguttaceae bacterium]|jgi:hypothetical protein